MKKDLVKIKTINSYSMAGHGLSDYKKIIELLAHPEKYGGNVSDSDVIIPSFPGYGFSTPLKETGINFWNLRYLGQTYDEYFRL